LKQSITKLKKEAFMTKNKGIIKILGLAAAACLLSDATMAQGLYRQKTPEPVTAPTSTPRVGGLYKAPGTGEGEVIPPTPTNATPLGDGLLILAALGGSYLIAKKKKKQHHES
jgi:hypothetical protein